MAAHGDNGTGGVGDKPAPCRQTPQTLERAIAQVAFRQHGNVTRAQLLDLGLGRQAIDYRRKVGRLHRMYRGVYSVGRRPITPIEHAAAAVLACGPSAVLSHRSALALWGLAKQWPAKPEITVTNGDRRPTGITIHRPTLKSADMTVHFGIRVTSPARTVLDCTPTLSDKALARAVNDARLAHILTPEALRDALDRAPNHPGRKALQRHATPTAGPTRSEWEDAFPAFCRRYGLPEPVMGASVGGFEVDALFAAEKLIVELDSWAFHQDRNAFETDRNKDAETLEAGYATVRITWARLSDDPDHEAERLEAILSARRGPTARRAAPAAPRRARRRRAR